MHKSMETPPPRSRERVKDLAQTLVKSHQCPYPLGLEFRSNTPTTREIKVKHIHCKAGKKTLMLLFNDFVL